MGDSGHLRIVVRKVYWVYWRNEGVKRRHSHGPYHIFEDAERMANELRQLRKRAMVWIETEEASE